MFETSTPRNSLLWAPARSIRSDRCQLVFHAVYAHCACSSTCMRLLHTVRIMHAVPPPSPPPLSFLPLLSVRFPPLPAPFSPSASPFPSFFSSPASPPPSFVSTSFCFTSSPPCAQHSILGHKKSIHTMPPPFFLCMS